MKLTFVSRLAIVTSLLLQTALAAETSHWEVTYLPDRKVINLNIIDYVPITVLTPTNADCSIREILVEVLPGNSQIAKNFSIQTGEKFSYGMDSRLAVNFQPKDHAFSEFLTFLEKKFPPQDFLGYHNYLLIENFKHLNSKCYTYISFFLDDLELIKGVFDQLATLSQSCEIDREKIMGVYQYIESCTKLGPFTK